MGDIKAENQAGSSVKPRRPFVVGDEVETRDGKRRGVVIAADDPPKDIFPIRVNWSDSRPERGEWYCVDGRSWPFLSIDNERNIRHVPTTEDIFSFPYAILNGDENGASDRAVQAVYDHLRALTEDAVSDLLADLLADTLSSASVDADTMTEADIELIRLALRQKLAAIITDDVIGTIHRCSARWAGIDGSSLMIRSQWLSMASAMTAIHATAARWVF